MKIIDAHEIENKVAALIADCLCNVDGDTCALLKAAEKRETNEMARWALPIINENNELARKTSSPACQDTGLAVFFVEIGGEASVVNGTVESALNNAVRRAYGKAYGRMSVLSPVLRVNTGDNTPAVIHYAVTNGYSLKISFLAKGAGAENMSALQMLNPTGGKEGITAFISDAVKRAGANSCPPVILGVGIGGTMEKAAVMSKHALLRKVGEVSPDAEIAAYEKELLDKVNASGIGVQGFGGNNTCLAVHIETFPTHMAMLPVAVNIQCHCARHGEIMF